MSDPLDDLRQRVTEVDRRIVELVNDRLELVQQIKAHKEKSGIVFVDSDREAWMVADAIEHNRGPLSLDGLRRFYVDLLALVKRELERP